jgi:hypothetical protein
MPPWLNELDSEKFDLLVEVFFMYLYAIFYYTETPYATYIVFILSIFPSICIYLYDEGVDKIKQIQLNSIRIGFYILSFICILFPVGFLFRFLATTLRERNVYLYEEALAEALAETEGEGEGEGEGEEKDEEALAEEAEAEEEEEPSVKIIKPVGKTIPWVYYIFIFLGGVLLCILIGLNQIEGLMLSYGLLCILSISYLVFVLGRDTLLTYFFNIVLFWGVQIPLFYTGNDYEWIFIFPALYYFWIFYNEPILVEKDKTLTKEEEDSLLIHYISFRSFLGGFVLMYGTLWFVAACILATFYAADLERVFNNII